MTTASSLSLHFDALFGANPDPWGTRVRWYEQRKRALTLAMLPAARYERAFEPGCAIGELTAALAPRCDELLATDASAAAVVHAKQRLARMTNVHVGWGSVPDDWPEGPFDLIVISELGYYLSEEALRRTAALARSSKRRGATLVACHWRRGASDILQSAEHVHATLAAGFGGARIAHYEDDDILLDVWSDDERSTAQRDGLA